MWKKIHLVEQFGIISPPPPKIKTGGFWLKPGAPSKIHPQRRGLGLSYGALFGFIVALVKWGLIWSRWWGWLVEGDPEPGFNILLGVSGRMKPRGWKISLCDLWDHPQFLCEHSLQLLVFAHDWQVVFCFYGVEWEGAHQWPLCHCWTKKLDPFGSLYIYIYIYIYIYQSSWCHGVFKQHCHRLSSGCDLLNGILFFFLTR